LKKSTIPFMKGYSRRSKTTGVLKIEILRDSIDCNKSWIFFEISMK
jgi:hypothetical protein